VALEATIGKDGPNVALKIDLSASPYGRKTRRCEKKTGGNEHGQPTSHGIL
jgi:hypothetical protein